MSKTINLEGFYTYASGQVAGDNGYMKFPIQWNTSNKTITGKGTDNAGPFTIFGIFDGTNLRFIKKYPSWEWKYIGSVVQQPSGYKPDGVYRFAGGWGNGSVQDGTWVLTGTEEEKAQTMECKLEGEWDGWYAYSGGANRDNMKTRFKNEKNLLKIKGSDSVGTFEYIGTWKDNWITSVKKYDGRDLRWFYSGVLEGKVWKGVWGDASGSQGTFEFTRVKGYSYEDAKCQLPPPRQVCGQIGGSYKAGQGGFGPEYQTLFEGFNTSK